MHVGSTRGGDLVFLRKLRRVTKKKLRKDKNTECFFLSG